MSERMKTLIGYTDAMDVGGGGGAQYASTPTQLGPQKWQAEAEINGTKVLGSGADARDATLDLEQKVAKATISGDVVQWG